MTLALHEAEKALEHQDVPVGCVVFIENEVVASRHNEKEHLADPTAHAELLALRDAANTLGRWRLQETTVVVTLEPCLMCAGGLVAARVARLVYGADDPKTGACGSLYNVCVDPRLNHELAVIGGVLAKQSTALLDDFFATRRLRSP